MQDGVLPDDFDDRMDAILPTFPYTLSPGSESSCQQQSLRGCRQGVTVKTATYGTTQKYNVVLCACGDGGYDTRSLADAIARVPGYLIGFVTSEFKVCPEPPTIVQMQRLDPAKTVYPKEDLLVFKFSPAFWLQSSAITLSRLSKRAKRPRTSF